MLGALTSLLSVEPFDALEELGLPTRTGSTVPRLAPFGIFPAADGWVALCAPTDTFARGVFAAIGRPELADDDRFRTRDRRVGHADPLHTLLGEWARSRKKADIVTTLGEYGVPAAEVREPAEAIQDEVVRAREEVVDLVHPEYGSSGVSGPGIPIRFSAAQVSLDRPAPHLGEHNQTVLRDLLGYDEARIDALRSGGVV
jgi:crotonobetainyl-CoA:carnitine CoA-transferase CaiB-like acyl-CoA transferase